MAHNSVNITTGGWGPRQIVGAQLYYCPMHAAPYLLTDPAGGGVSLLWLTGKIRMAMKSAPLFARAMGQQYSRHDAKWLDHVATRIVRRTGLCVCCLLGGTAMDDIWKDWEVVCNKGK